MCLAVPMKVIELIPPDKAVVESEGITMEISVMLVSDVKVGDFVIVHTGFAIEILDLEEAEKTLSLLRELADTGRE